jgi:outer membrane protein
MNKLSVSLYVILFAAVSALFILHFSGSSKKDSNSSVSPLETTARGIAFVNIDTVIFKFDMFSDRKEELLSKQKQAEAELNSKGTLYEKNAKDYQDKVNKGLVTRATAAQMEQSLLQQQQEVVSLSDKLQSNLMEEEQVMNRQILEYITSYLQSNKMEYNHQYIFGKSFGGVMLYGDEALDITKKVLEGINKKYKAEKK